MPGIVTNALRGRGGGVASVNAWVSADTMKKTAGWLNRGPGRPGREPRDDDTKTGTVRRAEREACSLMEPSDLHFASFWKRGKIVCRRSRRAILGQKPRVCCGMRLRITLRRLRRIPGVQGTRRRAERCVLKGEAGYCPRAGR